MNDRPDDVIKPTKQRLRRAPGFDELTETQAGGVTRKSGAVRVWSQLENLYRNGRLTSEQHQAGLKYYADWYIGLESRGQITMKWSEYISGLGGSGNMDAAERRVFHAKRFAEVNKRLEELGTRKAIHWLVINDIKPEDIGRKFWGYSGRKTASAGAVTGIGLSLQMMARFYGLVK
jgi:hypothetical protein